MYGDQTATLLQMLGITDDSELGKNILEEQVEDLVHTQPKVVSRNPKKAKKRQKKYKK